MANEDRKIGLLKKEKHYNTDEWRQAALHFLEYGRYTNFPPNGHPSSRYYKFWEEEARRCVYGHDIGRDFIPGYFYFYLNYCPIYIADEKGDRVDTDDIAAMIERSQADRIPTLPDFWDGDYEYYHYLEDAEKRGEHGAVIKTRGRGYSFKGASMCNRNYYMIPGSKSYCMADDADYLTEDGILSKAWDMQDHIESYTGWGKRRTTNTIMHRKTGYKMERGGLSIVKGFKSEIIGVTLKNNWNKARGKRGKLILWEESGKNPNLLKSWNIALKSMQQGRLTFGLMCAFGTGGTEDVDFMGLEQLFYDGNAHNIYMIPNKWDDAAGQSTCGYFSSVLLNLEGAMDEDGNSDEDLARKMVEAERDNIRKSTKNPETIIRHIAEEPMKPEEAVLRIGGTIFPINDLKEQLAELRAYPEKYSDTEYIGQLVIAAEEKKVKWKPDPDARPIVEFPIKDKRMVEGAIVIYEHPVKNSEDEVAQGIYIAGNDPYDHDESSTDSLGSTFIMNRVTERIVAEYTGRPVTAKMYYENVRRLLLYYNARLNYENNLKGLYTYFDFKNSTYLLCDTPKVVHDKVFDKGLLNRGKGTPGTEPINKWGRELILQWLITPVSPDSEIMNLHKIRSVPLLNELIYWHKDGNFDRVSALGMMMILKDEVAKWIPDEEARPPKVPKFFARQPMFQAKMVKQNDPFAHIEKMRKLKP